MPPESDIKKGYNLAANDLAAALIELYEADPHSSYIAWGIAARFNELKALRFPDMHKEISPEQLKRVIYG